MVPMKMSDVGGLGSQHCLHGYRREERIEGMEDVVVF